MGRFIEGEDRRQPTLLPSRLDDYVGEENAARVVDVFVDELDLGGLGLEGEAGDHEPTSLPSGDAAGAVSRRLGSVSV